MTPKLVSVDTAAEYLTVSPHTVRLWARQRRFKWYKVGSRMLIDEADLEKFVSEHLRGRMEEAAV
jgi:excisionase family DNA binding protein